MIRLNEVNSDYLLPCVLQLRARASFYSGPQPRDSSPLDVLSCLHCLSLGKGHLLSI